MWQPGETIEFRASDHVRAVHRHAGGKFLDYAVVNMRSITSALKKTLRQQCRPSRGKRYRRPHEDGPQSRGRQPRQPYRQDPPRSRRDRRRSRETGPGRPPPQERIIVVMHKPVTIVILAAGLGTRMKSRQAKVLHKAGGKTLLQHVIDTALELAPPERIFAVVGPPGRSRAPIRGRFRYRLHPADRTEGHRPRRDDRPRCHGAPGWLPDGALRRLSAAAHRHAAPPDRAGNRGRCRRRPDERA